MSLANTLLSNHSGKADLGADAPGSVAEIRERLERATEPLGCLCNDGAHENALHDLATSDVPVLLAAYEHAVADLAKARNVIEQVRAEVESLPDHLRSPAVRRVIDILADAEGSEQ